MFSKPVLAVMEKAVELEMWINMRIKNMLYFARNAGRMGRVAVSTRIVARLKQGSGSEFSSHLEDNQFQVPALEYKHEKYFSCPSP